VLVPAGINGIVVNYYFYSGGKISWPSSRIVISNNSSQEILSSGTFFKSEFNNLSPYSEILLISLLIMTGVS
jgi:hypothetical protein